MAYNMVLVVPGAAFAWRLSPQFQRVL